jgi:predicted dehydrogenase
MAMDAAEARRMLEASRQHPELVTQVVPSPLGLRAHQVVVDLLADGFLGDLREVVVLGVSDAAADPQSPLHWRQSAAYSGLNMLSLGILHETLTRWVPDPVRVLAQTRIFTAFRRDAESGRLCAVGAPDSVHVLTQLPNGARGLYRLSGAIHFGPGSQIHLYGAKGTLKYLLAPEDRLLGAKATDRTLKEIPVPADKEGGWRVEQEFISAIRGEDSVKLNDFATGVRYMEFTEAVARSAASGAAVEM